MDARERLRRYLEQRRELGESELVLDGMAVEDVLKVVGAKDGMTAARRAAPRGDAAVPEFGKVSPEFLAPADHPRLHGEGTPGVQELPPASPLVPEAEERGRDLAIPGVETGDWRAALRAAEAAPTPAAGAPAAGQPAAERPRPPAQPTPPAPPSPAAPAAPAPERSVAPAPPVASGRVYPGTDVPVGLVVGVQGSGMFDGPLADLDTLDRIAETVRGCTRCPLYRTATHGVPGEGNPDADFMVVGEAPGADEDASGRPFVGASGQLLTKILAAIKLAREDVFIANVVKHRPPGNRNPMPEEVAACSPYLLRQIELVRPKVILTVGNFAAQTLLETKLGISKLRGQVHVYHGVPLVATYHPAALLRNPTWKRPTWEDVQLARRLLDHATQA